MPDEKTINRPDRNRLTSAETLPVSQDLLRMLVSLVARVAFPQDRLLAIVAKRGKGASKWIKAYNLCDGVRSQADVAKLAGVDKSDLSKALTRWEGAGVLYRLGPEQKPLGLYSLPMGDEENEAIQNADSSKSADNAASPRSSAAADSTHHQESLMHTSKNDDQTLSFL